MSDLQIALMINSVMYIQHLLVPVAKLSDWYQPTDLTLMLMFHTGSGQ